VRQVVSGPCPSCNTEIEYLYQTENIPFFSDILIISAICPSCGFRYVDTQLLKSSEPVRYEMPVTTRDDLDIRVVRSTTSLIEIPELGVRIDPGPACQGFISNVDGVLDRVEQVVKGALAWGNEAEKENACAILTDIALVRAGTFPITIILQDPLGNSALISDTAKKTAFQEEPE
jgi:zinc finger protein